MSRHDSETNEIANEGASSSGGAAASSRGRSSSLTTRDLVAGIHGYEAQVQRLAPPGSTTATPDIQTAAADGVSQSGSAVPFGDSIQRSFGGYDISNVQAHTGPEAAHANATIGSAAYATGNDIAFGGTPDLHTTAHELAHVVQQRAGVSLSGGVGVAGDAYEQHADRVADAVVAGKSAEPILAEMAGDGASSPGVQRKQVQLKEEDPVDDTPKEEPPLVDEKVEEQKFLTGPGPLREITPPVLTPPVVQTPPVVVAQPPAVLPPVAKTEEGPPPLSLTSELGSRLEPVAVPEVVMPSVPNTALYLGAFSFGSDLRVAGIKAIATIDTAAINTESNIRKGAISAKGTLAAALVTQNSEVQTAANQAKSAASLAVEQRAQTLQVQLEAQKRSVDGLKTTLPAQIDAAFDKLIADTTFANLKAVSDARKVGASKQESVQVIPATGDLSDYERRQNKARGDTASKVTDHVINSLAASLAEALRDIASRRAEMHTRANEWLAGLETAVVDALSASNAGVANAQAQVGVSFNAAIEELDRQLQTVKAQASAAIDADALTMITNLFEGAAKLKQGIADGIEGKGEAITSALTAASDRLEVALADIAGRSGLDPAAQQTARAGAEQQALALVSGSLATVADMVRDEAVDGAGQLAELGKGAVDGLGQAASNAASAMAGVPAGLAALTAAVGDEALAAVDVALQEPIAVQAGLATMLTQSESFPAEMAVHTAETLANLKAEFTGTVSELPALIDTHAESAAGQVDKNAKKKGWAAVLVSVVSVAATAVTIGVAAAIGTPLALALGILGAGGIAVAKKLTNDAITKPTKKTSTMKEAILGVLTGAAAAAGAVWMLQPASAGDVSVAELGAILAGLKAFIAFSTKVGVRVIAGTLPRILQLDKVIDWAIAKLSGGDDQKSLPPKDLDATISDQVNADNDEAKKIKGANPYTTATAGHITKALIGG